MSSKVLFHYLAITTNEKINIRIVYNYNSIQSDGCDSHIIAVNQSTLLMTIYIQLYKFWIINARSNTSTNEFCGQMHGE